MIYLYQLYKVIMFIFLTYLFTSLFLSFRTRKTRREVEVAEEFFCYFLYRVKRGESHRRNIKNWLLYQLRKNNCD